MQIQTAFKEYRDFHDYGIIPRKFSGELPKPKSEKNDNNNIGIDKRIEYTMRMFPPLRKFYNVIEGAKTGNYLLLAGMGFRFANEFEEDLHDLKDIFNKKYIHEPDWQFPFPMIKTCPVEKTWVGKKLKRFDITLFETKIFKKMLKKLGMTGFEENERGLIKINGSKFAKVIGGAALRVPLLGAALFAIIEFDDVRKAKNKLQECLKAAIRIVFVMGSAAILGRAGRYHSKLLDVAGLGGGIILGNKFADKINSKLFSEKVSSKFQSQGQEPALCYQGRQHQLPFLSLLA